MSSFILYSPIFSRFNRLSVTFISAITGLFFSALFYAARNGTPDKNDEDPLPPASLLEVVIIAMITFAIGLPVTRFYAYLYTRVCTYVYIIKHTGDPFVFIFNVIAIVDLFFHRRPACRNSSGVSHPLQLSYSVAWR